MFLVGVDPSGSMDPPRNNNERLLTVTGLVLHDSNLDSFENSLRDILYKYFKRYDIELHAKDISSRRGIFREISKQKLNDLYFEVLQDGLKYIKTIIVVIVEKTLFRQNYAQNMHRDDFRLRLAEICFRNLIERLLYWNNDNGCQEYMLLILDDNAFGRLRGQERAYRDFIINELRSGKYVSRLPCRKLFPIAAFADSKEIRLIQLADLVAWAVRRVIFRPSHAFLRIVDFIEIIKQRIRQSQGRKLGYGIKLIPDSLQNEQEFMDKIRHFLL